MNLDIVLRLESRVDRLIEVKEGLEAECLRLRDENKALLEERSRVRSELDRILGKLDEVGEEVS